VIKTAVALHRRFVKYTKAAAKDVTKLEAGS